MHRVSSAVAVYPLVPTRSFDEPLTYGLPDELAAIGARGHDRRGAARPRGPGRRGGGARRRRGRRASRSRPSCASWTRRPFPAPLVELAEWVADQYGCARTVALSLVVGPRFAAPGARERRAAPPAPAGRAPDRRGPRRHRPDEAPARARSARPAWRGPPLARAARTRRHDAADDRQARRGRRARRSRSGSSTSSTRPSEEVDGRGVDIVAAAKPPQPAARSCELTPAQLDAVDRCWGERTTIRRGPRDAARRHHRLRQDRGVPRDDRARARRRHAARSCSCPRSRSRRRPRGASSQRFPGIVEVLHSAMTKAQRAAAHERIARGSARVVVGPALGDLRARAAARRDRRRRGARRLLQAGLRAALRRASRRVPPRRSREGARLVLGSATPRPESWHGVAAPRGHARAPGGGRLAPVAARRPARPRRRLPADARRCRTRSRRPCGAGAR